MSEDQALPFATVATLRVVCPHDREPLVEFIRLASGQELVQNVHGWEWETVSAEPVPEGANVRTFGPGHPFEGATVRVGRLPAASVKDERYAASSGRADDEPHDTFVYTCPRARCLAEPRRDGTPRRYRETWRGDGATGQGAVVSGTLAALVAAKVPFVAMTVQELRDQAGRTG